MLNGNNDNKIILLMFYLIDIQMIGLVFLPSWVFVTF